MSEAELLPDRLGAWLKLRHRSGAGAAGYVRAGPILPPCDVLPERYAEGAREAGRRWRLLARAVREGRIPDDPGGLVAYAGARGSPHRPGRGDGGPLQRPSVVRFLLRLGGNANAVVTVRDTFRPARMAGAHLPHHPFPSHGKAA